MRLTCFLASLVVSAFAKTRHAQNFTMRLICLLATLVVSASAKTLHAQTTGIPEADMDPRVTEQYVDVPVVRPGSTVGEAPADAVVLFDGRNLERWVHPGGKAAAWTLADGAMTVKSDPAGGSGDLQTRDSFSNFQLHLEFRTPAVVAGNGQGRGNSGLFLQDRYEVQILDSYDNPTYSNGQAASVYKQTPPMANASRKPGEWQTYDVFYTAPVFGSTGTLIHPAYVTVVHNGVLVQHHTAIQGTTPYKGRGVYEPHGPAPIRLQDHGNPTSFRNIWLRPL